MDARIAMICAVAALSLTRLSGSGSVGRCGWPRGGVRRHYSQAQLGGGLCEVVP